MHLQEPQFQPEQQQQEEADEPIVTKAQILCRRYVVSNSKRTQTTTTPEDRLISAKHRQWFTKVQISWNRSLN
jgi:hypothetical protein